MGKVKNSQLNTYLYCKENDLPVWRPPVSTARAIELRNNRRHNPNPDWHEDMPDLTGQALADAQRDFINEADDMPLWIQLDLWEGKHGIGTFTAWDLAGGTDRGQ